MKLESGFDLDWVGEGFLPAAACDCFQLMFETNRLGRPLTPEEVKKFKEKSLQ